MLDERIEQSIRQQGNIAKRDVKLQEQIKQWTAQMETLAKEFDVLEAKRDEAAEQVTNLEQQQQERLQAQKDNEAKIQELTDSNFEDMRKMVELRNEIRQLETEQEQRMNRRNRLKDDVDAFPQGGTGTGCSPLYKGRKRTGGQGGGKTSGLSGRG